MVTEVIESGPSISCLSFLQEVRWRPGHWSYHGMLKWSLLRVLWCCLVLRHKPTCCVRDTLSITFGEISTNTVTIFSRFWEHLGFFLQITGSKADRELLGWGKDCKKRMGPNTSKVAISLVIFLIFQAWCRTPQMIACICLKDPAWAGDGYRAGSSNLRSPIQLGREAAER